MAFVPASLGSVGTAQSSVSHRPGSARHGQGDRGNQGETCVQRLQAGCGKSRWTKSQSPGQFLRSGWDASRIDGRPHRRRDAVSDVQRTAVREFEIKRDFMRARIVLFALLPVFAIGGRAADFTGYVIDEACAAKTAMKGNEACARKCIKG